MPIVLMDLWHYKTVVSGITELFDFAKWLMEEKELDVESIRSNITDEDLEGVDLLLVLSPGYRFEKEEIEAVLRFVEKGGSLLVSRPSSKAKIINPLISKFGAEFTGEEADSWAFYADIPKELEERDSRYRQLKSILSEHEINKGLKAVAEGNPKQAYKPYLIRLLTKDWYIIGAARRKNKPYPTAIIKSHVNGKVAIIGSLYIFYKWKFWYENKEKEREKESYISNYEYMSRLIDYLIQ